MANQENAPESRLGQNWKTVALVAAVLLVGAVMGHSLLTGDQADTEATPAKPACQACPASATCASQDKAQATADGACAGETKASCCAQKDAIAASDATGESGCCAQKAAGCSGSAETFQTTLGCGGCPSSADSQ